jgi:hypothetical protein
LLRDAGLSLAYTALIVALLKSGLIENLELFGGKSAG